MEHATSKQLWKLQALAAERSQLMLSTGSEGDILTEIHLPLTKDGASAIIKSLIEGNQTLELLQAIKLADGKLTNKVYGEQNA